MTLYADPVDEWDDLLPPAEGWAPTAWTPMKSKRSLGPDICDFIEKFSTPPRERRDAGEFRLLPWQRWLINHIFELDSFGLYRYRTVFVHLPRKNGKSFIASAILQYLVAKGRRGDRNYIAARTSKQARIVYDVVMNDVQNSPLLSTILHANNDEIVHRYADVKLQRFSQDANQAMGTPPSFVVADELHAWASTSGKSNREADMWTSITTGSKDRDEFMVLAITTSGVHDGKAKELFDKGMRIASGEEVDDSFGFFSWHATDDDDIWDRELWKRVNPSLYEGILNMREFEIDFASAQQTSLIDFEIYALNKWLEPNAEYPFLAAETWAAAARPGQTIPFGAKIAVGFDGSDDEDTTSIIGLDLETGLMEVLAEWAAPKKNIKRGGKANKWQVDVQAVEDRMDEVFQQYDVRMLYADRSYYSVTLVKWRQKYGRGIVKDIPQSAVRMKDHSTDFKFGLKNGKLTHTNDPRLNAHMRNAVDLGKGRPEKVKKGGAQKIDHVIAAIMAAAGAQEYWSKNPKRDDSANAAAARALFGGF